MPITDQSERKFLGSGLLALGCSLGGLSAALSVVALDHMRAAANICGSNGEHCLTCIGALACLAAGLFAVSAALSLLRPCRPRVVAS